MKITYLLITFTALYFGTAPKEKQIKTWEEMPKTENFGNLKGIPKEIESISNRMESGRYVSEADQMILSDYIENEVQAWNEWVQSF